MINNVKSIRGKTGLSQREFAKRIGRTGAYISMVESGKIKVSEESMKAIKAKFPENKAKIVTTLPERLKLARKSRDYTQEDLAKAVGCNRNTISAAESGRSAPSSRILHDIAEKLWVSEDWLRFGTGRMERNEKVAEVLEAIRSDPNVRDAVITYLKRTNTKGGQKSEQDEKEQNSE